MSTRKGYVAYGPERVLIVPWHGVRARLANESASCDRPGPSVTTRVSKPRAWAWPKVRIVRPWPNQRFAVTHRR